MNNQTNNVKVRKSDTEWKLPKEEFKRRYCQLFYDTRFDSHRDKINEFAEIAWSNYEEGRKAPRTRKAGAGYQDPEYDLSIEWIEAKARIDAAQKVHEDQSGPRRILLICAAHRDDHTCPGEISKSYRLMNIALETLKAENVKVELLELNKMSSEYGKKIHPCKACVSTAMPLCHWPCSCYPNHSLGQVQDWMNDIYPKWVEAHGIMIITPVYWHQSPSALKSMMDRLVCADGGNSDPTSTGGKDPEKAKKLELKGWDYPRHLSGRCFSTVVHGDAMGVDDAKRTLNDWLEEMDLIPGGNFANIGRYIGYFKPYATSHNDLDEDKDVQKEVENAAKSLVQNVLAQQQKKLQSLIPDLEDPRPK